MSMMQNLMSQFSGAAKAGQPAEQQLKPAAPAAPAPAATPAPESTPAQPDQSPLAWAEKLWENAPTDPNAPPKKEGVFGKIDPNILADAAKNANFTSVLTPELKQRMANGGEDAINANLEAMNLMAQQVYAQSAHVSTQLIEQGIKEALKGFSASLPGMIKKHNVTNSLKQENPIFANPASAPVLNMIQTQLQNKYPKASESEITTMAKKYITDMASFNTPAAADESTAGNGGTDWTAYFDQNS